MRYGLIPTKPAERVALALGLVPVPMLDVFAPLVMSRCLMASSRLGVFEALRDGWRSADEIARATHLDAGVLPLLLRTLVVGRYLRQRGARFALTRLSRRHLLRGAPRELTGFLEFNYAQWDIVARLDVLLQTGRGIDFHRTLEEPAVWAAYQRAMLELSRFSAGWLASVVPVRRRARALLDLGGSHGAYGAAICRKHPPMRSTVLDLPGAIAHARALAVEAGHADVVEHREGDALVSELGTGWDVVLVSNLAHHFDDAQNRGLLARAHAATRAGGSVAIFESELPDARSPADFGDGAALYFRLSSDARTYGGAEMEGWLREAGYGRVRSHRALSAPGSIVVTGVKR